MSRHNRISTFKYSFTSTLRARMPSVCYNLCVACTHKVQNTQDSDSFEDDERVNEHMLRLSQTLIMQEMTSQGDVNRPHGQPPTPSANADGADGDRRDCQAVDVVTRQWSAFEHATGFKPPTTHSCPGNYVPMADYSCEFLVCQGVFLLNNRSNLRHSV